MTHPAPQRRSRRSGSSVTVQDVARAAGVSAQTVSNALNAPHRVKGSTRDQVMEAVEKLGYRPHAAARSLSTGRTGVIGYSVGIEDTFTAERALSDFLGEFLNGLVRAAAPDGYSVLVSATSGARDEVEVYRHLIASRSVDVVVLTDTVYDDERIAFLAEHEFPFVAFGRTSEGLPQEWVDIDNVRAMGQVVDHLVEQGRRDLAYLGTTIATPWVGQRRNGFTDALQRHGMTPASITTVPDSDAVHSAVTALLDSDDHPDAIVADNDATAVEVIRVLRARGCQVGQDIAVTGFNDFPFASLTEPPLTSVRIPLDTISAAIYRRAREILSGAEAARTGTIVDAPLMRRASA